MSRDHAEQREILRIRIALANLENLARNHAAGQEKAALASIAIEIDRLFELEPQLKRQPRKS